MQANCFKNSKATCVDDISEKILKYRHTSTSYGASV